MDDETRRLAQNARRIQNLQLWLLLGLIGGGIIGIIVAAYVVLPTMGMSFISMILALAVIIGGAFAGQRVVLSWLSR